MAGLLYEVQNPINEAMSGMQSAASTAASMDKKDVEYEEPKKTFGGTLQSGFGGALAGYTMSPLAEPFLTTDIELPETAEGLEIAQAGPLGGVPSFTAAAQPSYLGGVGAAEPSMESLGYAEGGALTNGTGLGGAVVG